jgi:hypothetical protein
MKKTSKMTCTEKSNAVHFHCPTNNLATLLASNRGYRTYGDRVTPVCPGESRERRPCAAARRPASHARCIDCSSTSMSWLLSAQKSQCSISAAAPRSLERPSTYLARSSATAIPAPADSSRHQQAGPRCFSFFLVEAFSPYIQDRLKDALSRETPADKGEETRWRRVGAQETHPYSYLR